MDLLNLIVIRMKTDLQDGAVHIGTPVQSEEVVVDLLVQRTSQGDTALHLYLSVSHPPFLKPCLP